jgi:hypothetical protein
MIESEGSEVSLETDSVLLLGLDIGVESVPSVSLVLLVSGTVGVISVVFVFIGYVVFYIGLTSIWFIPSSL